MNTRRALELHSLDGGGYGQFEGWFERGMNLGTANMARITADEHLVVTGNYEPVKCVPM